MPEVLVCKDGEIAEGGVRLIRVGREEIGVIRHRDKYYAYRNLCPHQGGPACEGLRMPQVVDRIGEGGILLGQTFDEDDMHIVCPVARLRVPSRRRLPCHRPAVAAEEIRGGAARRRDFHRGLKQRETRDKPS